ncbi:hypothetical protein ACHQM5_010320 [Ranunculus cassubicifolius]
MFGRPQCIVSLNVHESLTSLIHHNIEFVVIQFRIEECYRRWRQSIHTNSLLENKIIKAKCTLFQFPLEILHLHEMLELTVRQMLLHMNIHPVKHPLDYILNEITSVSRSKARSMAMSEPKKYFTILVDVNFVTTQIEIEKDSGVREDIVKKRDIVDSGNDKISLKKGASVDSSSMSSDNDDERCVFCACRLSSSAEIVRLPCSHVLHERCRQRLGSERCPSKICRGDHA